ncbi:MAG: DUF4330 domain-containing protein [Desulfotomaculales bacterium]
MRLIDEKGKLFGIINVIDLLVILVVLLVVAGAAYKFLVPAAATPPTTVRLEVLIPAVHPETAAMVKVGDRLVAGASYVPVTVKDVRVEPALTTETDSAGRRVIARDPFFKDVYVTLEGETAIPAAQIKMGAQEIRAGREYFVKSLTYELKGTIVKVTLNPVPGKSIGR